MLPRWIPALCRWHRFERARERYLRRPALPEALRTLLAAPLPSDSTPLCGLSLLSLDVETSGLDPKRDQLLSIGSVVLAQGQIRLDGASHLFVQSDALDRRSAVIHHILPEMLQNGVSLDDAMMQLFSQLTGRVALAHGSTVERRFIDHYLADRFGLPPLPQLWLDTLHIEKRYARLQGFEQPDLRLAAVRDAQGLPAYPAHIALTDAVACAELLLVQAHRCGPDLQPLRHWWR